MMVKNFFNVTDLENVLELVSEFKTVGKETVPILKAGGRIIAENIISDVDLPDFARSTMDGYAVQASSTFGASEGNPAFLKMAGTVLMGETAGLTIAPGEAARISTGGMLPEGADSVVMIEHSQKIDETALEIYRSVAPGSNIIEKGEDFRKGETILSSGRMLRPQEIGLLAAFGRDEVNVYKKPIVGIISTGDEIVPINENPGPARIRDINSYSLSDFVIRAGGIPVPYGIVRDNFFDLKEKCSLAHEKSDMVMISGGSSVGTRDYTIDVLSSLPDAKILVHGISISPGKPTILATASGKPVWGLPGHVVSSMVVFHMVVRPFIEHISGRLSGGGQHWEFPARLSRNISSAQGRLDCIRVRLTQKEGVLEADPILGKSALINTMVKADGIIVIGLNSEGLEKGTTVSVIPI